MRRLWFILCLVSFCSLIQGDNDGIPRKTNIGILVDVEKSYHNFTVSLLQKILEGISLARYRISLFTTSGLSYGILKFQSRRCMLNAFKEYKQRHKTIGDMINDVYVNTFKRFGRDEGILLIMTDRDVSKTEKRKFTYMRKGRDTPTFFVHIDKLPRLRKLHLFNKGKRWNHLIQEKLPFYSSNLNSCKGKYVRDECNRLCLCKDGKMINCYRVRKEFSSMKEQDRLRYISTYKEMGTNSKYQEMFRHYLQYHPKSALQGIHERGQFFPWHRKYLLGFENMLRLADCRVTIPFWNWAYHSENAWSITPSYHMWRDEGGFGSNGNSNLSFCVDGGEFSYRRWEMKDDNKAKNIVIRATCGVRQCCGKYKFDDDDTDDDDDDNRTDDEVDEEEKKCLARLETLESHRISKCMILAKEQNLTCLRRRFSSKPPSYRSVYKIIKYHDASDFEDFEYYSRVVWHNGIHYFVGGNMETAYSSLAPEFWLHHGILDAFWDTWQRRGKEFEWNHEYDNVSRLVGFDPVEVTKFYIHNHNLAGCGIKILYDNVLPNDPDEVEKMQKEYMKNTTNGFVKGTHESCPSEIV